MPRSSGKVSPKVTAMRITRAERREKRKDDRSPRTELDGDVHNHKKTKKSRAKPHQGEGDSPKGDMNTPAAMHSDFSTQSADDLLDRMERYVNKINKRGHKQPKGNNTKGNRFL